MEFLGVGPLEFFFIILIALIVLGPKDMVKAGRTIGRFLRKTILSPSWLNIQRKVRTIPYTLMREAGLEELDLDPGIGKFQEDVQGLTEMAPPEPARPPSIAGTEHGEPRIDKRIPDEWLGDGVPAEWLGGNGNLKTSPTPPTQADEQEQS